MADWTRVEAMSRTVGLSGGLEARVADPLWLLARQWQVGEFRGDDAARPTATEVTYRSMPVQAPPGAPAGTPIDAAVEAAPEPARGAAGLHATVRAGRRLSMLLGLAGLGDAREALAQRFQPQVPQDAVTAGSLDAARCALMARHGVDGRAVAQASAEDLAAALGGLTAARRDASLGVIRTWAAQFLATSAGSPADAWDDERLEYAFTASARLGPPPPRSQPGPPRPQPGSPPPQPGPAPAPAPTADKVTLNAPEHPGGEVDWYTFDLQAGDVQAGATPGPAASAALPAGGALAVPGTLAAIPAAVRYLGMPASRWFEFEDGRVDFADLDAGPADVARLLVAEFATSYSDDWFLIPMRLGVGTLTEVTSMRVVDNFGGSAAVASVASLDTDRLGADRPWRLFELDGDAVSPAHPSPWLLLPPSVAGSLGGPPVERVVFARDDAANLAWGIEALVEGPAGRAVDRPAAWTGAGLSGPAARPSRVPGSATQPADGLWRYRLEAPAPPWWIPLIPERLTAGRSDIRLRRARMESWNTLAGGPLGPQSEVLDPTRPVWLREEEVPATGVVIERRWRFARWHDGTTQLWLERSKRPGGGNRSSGVRWDIIRTT